MFSRDRRAGTRLPALLAVTVAVATEGGLAYDPASASARTAAVEKGTSENWAGYIAKSNSARSFSNVSGSWTEPAAKANSSSTSAYSAFWVGIGGSSGVSQSLEQVGTSSDWVNGHAAYYAWYELLPAAQVRLNLAIHAGDRISASVSVNGNTVTIHLSDEYTGGSVTKTESMSDPDTSSAEWIAEAPAAASASGEYQTLPLADFGTVNFAGASATAGGHKGSISDSSWTVQQVNLASAGGATGGGPGVAGFAPGAAVSTSSAAAAASPSSLSSDGTAFSVSYSESADGSASQAGDGGGYGSDGSGYGSDGGGYGSDGGYGYDPGYGYGYDGGGPPGFLQ